MTDHPDWNCPHCQECDGCGGGDGSTPRNWYLDRDTRPGVVLLMCRDCHGAALICNCRCHADAAEVPA